MSIIRKLYLMNQAGTRYSLGKDSTAVMVNLSGLGYQDSISFADYANGFFSAIKNKPSQQTINGDLIFLDISYYKTLVDWIQSATSLTFIQDYGSGEYMVDVELQYINQGYRENGVLKCPVSFHCKSPWYKPTTRTLNFVAVSGDSLHYPFKYTSSLIYSQSSVGNAETDLTCAGHIPAAFTLSFKGTIVNPIIKLTSKSTGEVYGTCSLTYSFGSTDTLQVSTKYMDSYVRKKASDGTITDLVGILDITNDPFFHMPVGEELTLSLQSQAAFTGTVSATIYEYYRSV